ncbi:MAG: 16S rRNA (adenine(1518)-N(6)/adenine(1519)-N(6))-dimethyltransferase RsmA [Clostridia bacterium]|nr:16S rRNA (adenine(1518)-N(6)/adenine(1519)-N(6))-dimethyltransferase RsmA [Clostridia bacterium]
MEKLTNISFVKDLLSAAGFTFSKQMGQNFLINPSVCPRMAQECGCDGIGVIEIGPGIGVLTVELAKRAKKVVSIELDTRLKPVLDVTLKNYDNVTVIYGDVLKLDLMQIINEHFADMEVCVCANLPYYITSPIIMSLLESKLPFKAITVMVQKEAAVRLAAEVGTRQCGAVTAAVSYYAQAKRLFNVERGSFLPAPNVDSSVIRLDVRSKPPVDISDEKAFFKVIKASFGQRRKTLSNSLSSGLGLNKDKVNLCILKAGLKATARAEELTLKDFASLTDILFKEE